MKKLQLEGQINIFDYLESLKDCVLTGVKSFAGLMIGQHLYKVSIGDIEDCLISNFFDSSEMKGCFLKKESGLDYCCIEDIGYNVFTSKEQAEKVAEKNLSSASVILAKDMEILGGRVFSFIRKKDKKQIPVFYLILRHGYVYIQDADTYAHIIRCTEEDALKHCMSCLDGKKYVEITNEGYPYPKNMYKCEGPWEYTEAACSLCLN